MIKFLFSGNLSRKRIKKKKLNKKKIFDRKDQFIVSIRKYGLLFAIYQHKYARNNYIK